MICCEYLVVLLLLEVFPVQAGMASSFRSCCLEADCILVSSCAILGGQRPLVVLTVLQATFTCEIGLCLTMVLQSDALSGPVVFSGFQNE